MAFGPVPPGPPSLIGALVLLGMGVVGSISTLLHVVGSGLREVKWQKLLLFCLVDLFFILGGLIELSKIK
jgi:hypothetical protein